MRNIVGREPVTAFTRRREDLTRVLHAFCWICQDCNVTRTTIDTTLLVRLAEHCRGANHRAEVRFPTAAELAALRREPFLWSRRVAGRVVEEFDLTSFDTRSRVKAPLGRPASPARSVPDESPFEIPALGPLAEAARVGRQPRHARGDHSICEPSRCFSAPRPTEFAWDLGD